jgi:hypothetical protein
MPKKAKRKTRRNQGITPQQAANMAIQVGKEATSPMPIRLKAKRAAAAAKAATYVRKKKRTKAKGKK